MRLPMMALDLKMTFAIVDSSCSVCVCVCVCACVRACVRACFCCVHISNDDKCVCGVCVCVCVCVCVRACASITVHTRIKINI